MTLAGLSTAILSDLRPFRHERRCRQRYELRFPVTMRRQETNFHGETTNMSAVGVSFVAPVKPDLGEQIDFEVRLPEDRCSQCEVRLLCRARVVRVERRAGSYRIAASLIDHDFLRCPLETACLQTMRAC